MTSKTNQSGLPTPTEKESSKQSCRTTETSYSTPRKINLSGAPKLEIVDSFKYTYNFTFHSIFLKNIFQLYLYPFLLLFNLKTKNSINIIIMLKVLILKLHFTQFHLFSNIFILFYRKYHHLFHFC
jgi:hypothetical protein